MHYLCRVILLVGSVNLLAAQEPDQLSTWTSTEGKSIQADFVRMDGDTVVLRINGNEVAIPKTRLSPVSLVQANNLNAAKAKGFPDAGLKPLWVLRHSEIGKAGEPWKIELLGLSRQEDLIYSATSKIVQGQAHQVVIALVDKTSGRMKWRTSLSVRENCHEIVTAHTVLDDGAILLCSSSLRKDSSGKQYSGLLLVRRLDDQTGALISQTQMALDDPKSDKDSASIDLIHASSVKISTQGHHAILTSKYLVEMTPDFTKVINASTTPKPQFIFAYTSRGAVWSSISDPTKGYVADWGGGTVRDLTPVEASNSSILASDNEPARVTTTLNGNTVNIVAIEERKSFQPITITLAPNWERRVNSAKLIGSKTCILRFTDSANMHEQFEVAVSLP
jgi:hypothetical protein